MKSIRNKWGMKKLIQHTSNDAVVGIVTAILIIGLIATVISLVQTMYVPKIMEQREAEHMDKVAEQFAALTSIIDGQAAEQRRGIPIATSITLGSRELPYLVSSKAFGILEILENACNITIINESAPNNIHASVFPIGTITYSSTNAYFLDQSYIYEVGAMIVSQIQGNLMMVPPNFFVEYNDTTNIVNITFDVVNISGVMQKTTAAGFGTYPIQTEFRDISTDTIFTDVRNITISTKYSNAWFLLLNSSLMGANLNYAGYGTQFLLTDTGSAVQMVFLSNGLAPTVNILFRLIEIRAQIGPGWVE
jgi:hypothetical protein